MRLAVVAAGFTPGEADQLRRAMGAWRKSGVMEKFRDKLINGMLERGYTADFAQRVYQQICGFGEYGFPESHAASFALLVYVSAWLKCHYPAAFAAANGAPLAIPLWAVVGGLGATVVIGGASGIYPAARAARIPPTSALAAV